MRAAGCPLCDADGGRVIARGPRWRIVHAEEAGFPGFYRLIWNAHVSEFSMLDVADRHECVDILARIEAAMLRHLTPHKINLASLGNMVPHLHWHIVARYGWDSRFPAALWAEPVRTAAPELLDHVRGCLAGLERDLLGLTASVPEN